MTTRSNTPTITLMAAIVLSLAGKDRTNVVPLPNLLSTLMVPSILSTTWRTMERPRPVPPTSRDRALSTR